MFQKLRTVVYHVNDLEAAKAWYVFVTGKQPYFDEPFYVGFDINGCELGLDPDMSGVAPGNNSTAYWAVTGIDACVEKLAANGGVLHQPVQEVGGGIKVAAVNDPFGNLIGLIEGA
jgi:predicted enzyme related to lactoylglutathione lyase